MQDLTRGRYDRGRYDVAVGTTAVYPVAQIAEMGVPNDFEVIDRRQLLRVASTQAMRTKSADGNC